MLSQIEGMDGDYYGWDILKINVNNKDLAWRSGSGILVEKDG